MSAHPKNKITRVEQGKRRAGNTPKLKRDSKVIALPLHKRTMFAKFLALVSPTAKSAKIEKAMASTAKKPKADKAALATNAPTTGAMAKAAKPQTVKSAPVKKVTRTQHKGG